MIVIPAIDIIDGFPVRLYQGDYKKKEIVGESVIDFAKQFEVLGAKYIHLVDLDGAKLGYMKNTEVIKSVIDNTSLKVEVGGGIRTLDDIDCLINMGVDKIILGTAAIENFELLKEAINKYSDKIAVGIDCKNGFLCGRGWLKVSKHDYLEFIEKLKIIGVNNVIVTDIDKDGTLNGTNIEMIKAIKDKFDIKITASGGVKNIEDIKRLNQLNIYGAIVGKAIYSGNLLLNEAINICK